MNRQEILNLFQALSQSQGHWGRLLRDIYNYKDWGNAYLQHLEDKKFTDTLDLVLYVENGG